MKRENRLLFLALLIVILHQIIFFEWTSDDAFISYRYAESFSSGRGLVFNPGERVEGFSNFSWVMILALFNFLGVPPLWASKILSFILSLLMLLLIFRAGKILGLDRRFSSLCALTLSFSTSLAYYSMSGLESILYTFLMLLAVVVNEKFEAAPAQKHLFALYGILLAMAITRPEGIMFLLLSSGYHLLKSVLKKSQIRLKNLIMVELLTFCLFALFILIRWTYYGDILPNPFYAKPQGTFVEEGFSAFFINFMSGFWSGSFLIIPVLLLLVPGKAFQRYAYPLLLCFGQLIFMSYSGDWMALGRFFIPILPLVICLFFVSLQVTKISGQRTLQQARRGIWVVITIILLTAGNIYQTGTAAIRREAYPYLVMNSSRLIRAGQWLRENFPAQILIATRRQGAVPYFSKMRSIDLLGLTDRTIAKNIWNSGKEAVESNVEYIFNRKPDVILLFSFRSDFEGWTFQAQQPEDKLNYLEYQLFNRAIKLGYELRESLSLGKYEKAHFLAAPKNQ